MNTVNKIKEKIINENGVSDVDLAYNVEINNLIKLIAKEQKVSHLIEFGEGEETTLYVPGELKIAEKELIECIKKMFSSNPEIPSNYAYYFTDGAYVDGSAIKITREVQANGAVEFGYYMPENDYACDLINPQATQHKKCYNKILKKVLIPFYDYIQQYGDQILSGEIPKEQYEEYLEYMEALVTNIISKDCHKNRLNPNIVSKEFILNVCRARFGETIQWMREEKRIQESAPTTDLTQEQPPQAEMNSNNNTALVEVKTNIFQKIMRLFQKKESARDSFVSNMFASKLERNVQQHKYTTYEKLRPLLDGISAQMYMNSCDLTGLDSEQIEETIQKGFDMYTRFYHSDETYNVDEYGYRTVDVGFSGDLGEPVRDVLLHRKGDNIKKAMEILSSSIEELVSNKDRISEDEFIKRVAMIHYRYIAIHPFRDSNGRIGRNLINLLLSQKGMMFILDKSNKKTYEKKMEEARGSIPLKPYLNSLATNPEMVTMYENENCGSLASFIKSNTYRTSSSVSLDNEVHTTELNPNARTNDLQQNNEDRYQQL